MGSTRVPVRNVGQEHFYPLIKDAKRKPKKLHGHDEMDPDCF